MHNIAWVLIPVKQNDKFVKKQCSEVANMPLVGVRLGTNTRKMPYEVDKPAGIC